MKLLPPPGPERRRQLTLLAVLLVVLAGALWWRLGRGFGASPAATALPAGTPAAAGAGGGQLPVPPAVNLDTIGATATAGEVVRNPFGFGQRNDPAPPGSDFITAPGPITPPSFATAPEPQGPPPIPLLLTGLTRLDAGGRTLVTLKDPSLNVLHQAYEGDIVDGRYRVVKVGVQSVVVSYLDGSGIRTLPLGG